MLISRCFFSAFRYALILCARFVNNVKNSAKKKNKSGTTTIPPNNLEKSEAKKVGEMTYRRASAAARSTEEMTIVPKLTSQVRGARRAIVLFWLFCHLCNICEHCIIRPPIHA